MGARRGRRLPRSEQRRLCPALAVRACCACFDRGGMFARRFPTRRRARRCGIPCASTRRSPCSAPSALPRLRTRTTRIPTTCCRGSRLRSHDAVVLLLVLSRSRGTADKNSDCANAREIRAGNVKGELMPCFTRALLSACASCQRSIDVWRCICVRGQRTPARHLMIRRAPLTVRPGEQVKREPNSPPLTVFLFDDEESSWPQFWRMVVQNKTCDELRCAGTRVDWSVRNAVAVPSASY